ncbi:F-box/LRR-repeat protein 14 [Tetranychus urticae]|uniref:F-box/LRR-repeat protein 14 n=1 Tax=Tetranychus urticae TaxID=32264 RepID=UPI00077B9F75|nr:F-box/LRR-repeat protein 14 [Tetranychus urticae]XP_015786650.1 F-box/LRR-repeat protein 14 [Tetranychus urticae]
MERRNKKNRISQTFNSYPHHNSILHISYPHMARLHPYHPLHHQPSPVSVVGAASSLSTLPQLDQYSSTMVPSTESWLNQQHQHHSQPEPVLRCNPTNNTNDDFTEIDQNSQSGYKSNTTIEHLHPELLSIIFSYLDLRSKGRVSQVCSSWMDAAYDKSVWKGVEAKLHFKKLNTTMISSLNRRGIKRVQVLSFQKDLKELASIKNLERLTLTGCYNLTLELLSEALSQEMPSLKQLSLGMCKQITSVFLRLCDLFNNTPNIEVLDLGGCSEITDHALVAIRKCLKQLKQLNLRSCRYITDKGIHRLCLSQFSDDISQLDVWKPAPDDDGLANLELLDLQDCQTLSDDALKYISSGLKNLKSLNLSFCVGITDMGLKYLSSMTSLKEINLRSCTNITNTGLRYLSESGIKLNILDVSFCDKITDSGLFYISQGLTTLTTLSLNSCLITDEGLTKLSTSLTNLKTLNIGQCNCITDIGVSSLAENCHKLENIDLYGCTRITQAGQEKILKLPLLKYLNTGLWQDLQAPVYFHPFNSSSLVRDHPPGCVIKQSNRNFVDPSYYSSQLFAQYKSLYSANCGDNMLFRNCILTKLCDSCQKFSCLLNPTLSGSPLFIVIMDKS